MSGGYLPPLLPPGTWCPRCGARPGIAGPAWICRVCVAGGPHKRIVRNDGRRPLPAGTARARVRYRAAGLCVQCGRDRDRDDRLCCARCRRRLADASNRYRDAHPPPSAAANGTGTTGSRAFAAGAGRRTGSERTGWPFTGSLTLGVAARYARNVACGRTPRGGRRAGGDRIEPGG